MIIACCIYDFTKLNLALQPWLTILKLVEGLAKKGHQVHIITDVVDYANMDTVNFHCVASIRGSNDTQIKEVLASIQPDCLIVLPTPLNIISSGWLKFLPECKVFGYASYPFYTMTELFKAWNVLRFDDVKQYLRHLLIPQFIWKFSMESKFNAVVAQSQTTADRLRSTTSRRMKVQFIPPGINLSDWPYERRACNQTLRLLYLGAARPIRGFDLALKALARLQCKSVEFRILARGADESKIRELKCRLGSIEDKIPVSIVGGWLDHRSLVNEIHAADLVLQPFILVPSEFPVTAMEVIACGTPVVGSKIDGLPSTIGPAGTVTEQANVAALTTAIENFCSDAATRESWKDGCLKQRMAMLDWDRVVDQWEGILVGSKF